MKTAKLVVAAGVSVAIAASTLIVLCTAIIWWQTADAVSSWRNRF